MGAKRVGKAKNHNNGPAKRLESQISFIVMVNMF